MSCLTVVLFMLVLITFDLCSYRSCLHCDPRVGTPPPQPQGAPGGHPPQPQGAPGTLPFTCSGGALLGILYVVPRVLRSALSQRGEVVLCTCPERSGVSPPACICTLSSYASIMTLVFVSSPQEVLLWKLSAAGRGSNRAHLTAFVYSALKITVFYILS